MTENPKKPKSWLSAAALALLLVVGTPSIALARNEDRIRPVNQESTSEVNTLPTETEGSDDSRMYTTTISEQKVGESDKRQGGREKAKERVEKLRTERKVETTAEKREQVCEKRKNGLETKFASISRNSESFQTRIDGIYAKALVYQSDKALTSPELDELVAVAEEAKAEAAISIAALQNATLATVDCKNVNVATDVAAFKISATQAKDDLKVYKQAVKDVLKSLKSATANTQESAESAEDETKPEEVETN